MHLFYRHTKLIIVILSILNLVGHAAGFYVGIRYFDLLSSLIIIELMVILFGMVITIYKWFNDELKIIRDKQAKISSQLLSSQDVTRERIESLENKLFQQLKLIDQSNDTNKQTLINEIKTSQNQLKQLIQEHREENQNIQNWFEIVEKLIRNISDLSTKHSNELEKLGTAVNSDTEKLFSKLSKINSNDQTILNVLSENKKSFEKHGERLNNIQSSISDENRFLQQNFSELISNNNVKLSNSIRNTLNAIELLKREIKEEKVEVKKEAEQLESKLLHEISAILSDVNISKSENLRVLDKIANKLEQDKAEFKSSLQKEMNILKQFQNESISSSEYDLKKEISQSIKDQYYAIRKELNNTYIRIDALQSIYHLLKFEGRLPIMHDWTISSDYAAEIVNEIILNEGGVILDIGSGISTVLFGTAVRKCGKGKVISLEHSKEYYDKTKSLIKEHKLEEFCELYHTPLKEYHLNGKKWLWYDIEKVKLPEEINIISVDGPPGNTQHLSRYPALPILRSKISSKTVIYLDDANRDDEREIAKLWEKELNLSPEFLSTYKGLVVLRQ